MIKIAVKSDEPIAKYLLESATLKTKPIYEYKQSIKLFY